MDVRKFVLDSVLGQNELNRGFFVPLEEEKPCFNCNETFNFLHPTTQGRFWCANCYVKKYCDVVVDGEDFIIKQKLTSKILYQSSPIIEREREIKK